MDKKKDFQVFLRVLGVAVWAILAIAASAGCANFAATGYHFYWLPAAANLIGWGYVIYRVVKKWKEDGKLIHTMDENE